MLGEQNYFIALQLFRMTKEQLHIDSPEVTNWMILQESMKQKIDGVKNTRALISNFLQLFFNEKVMFGPRSILLNPPGDGEAKSIEPEDFDGLQLLIGQIGGSSLIQPAEEQFNPKNKRAAEIVEKMKKARKRLAAVKAAESGVQQNSGFLARYIRAVAVATSNSLEQVNSMTLLQLNEVMQTYLAWEAYDLEVKSRLAGAKGDKELVHWMMRNDKQENDSIGKI